MSEVKREMSEVTFWDDPVPLPTDALGRVEGCRVKEGQNVLRYVVKTLELKLLFLLLLFTRPLCMRDAVVATVCPRRSDPFYEITYYI